MGYSNPAMVISPKTRWKLTKVLCNTGQNGWAAAIGVWDDTPDTLAIRWNGDDDTGSPGNPQSHGNPTWFIVPGDLDAAVRAVAYSLDEAMSFVSFSYDQPADFEYGVWKIKIVITGKVLKAITNMNVEFDIPTLPKRFFRHGDKKYMAPPTGPGEPWRGRFLDGVWEAIVSTNGIEEKDNPTHMKVVGDALIASVMAAIKPWGPENLIGTTKHYPID